MMCALHDLRDQDDVRIRFVCVPDEESEEIDQRTSDLLVKAGYVGDFAITGEPTNLHVGVQAKGVLALRIMVYGTSAHGSTPWLGDNAVLKAIDVFRRIESMPFTLESSELFDRPSVNLGRIIGGDAPNKVPEECAMDVDIRYLPEQDPGELLAQIRALPGRPRRALVHLAARARVARRNPYVLALCHAASRLTDGESMSVGPRRRLGRRGLPEGGRPGGRVRALRRRPSRPRRVGLDRFAGRATGVRWSTSPAACPSSSPSPSRSRAAGGGRPRVKDGVPPPGRGVLLRALIAGVLTIALSATAVASTVLLEIDDVVDEFTAPRKAARSSTSRRSTRADAGDPRTFLILGTDERYADRKLKIKPRSDTIMLARVDPDAEADRGDVAPARSEGRDPGRGHGQDQRRLRDRRPAQDGGHDQAPVRGRDGRELPDQQRDQRQLRRLPARGQLRRRRLRRHRPPLLQRQHHGGARRGLRDDRRAARLPAAQGPGRARLRPLPPRRQRLLPRLAPAGLPAPDLAPGRASASCSTSASARSWRTSSAATSRSTSPS